MIKFTKNQLDVIKAVYRHADYPTTEKAASFQVDTINLQRRAIATRLPIHIQQGIKYDSVVRNALSEGNDKALLAKAREQPLEAVISLLDELQSLRGSNV